MFYLFLPDVPNAGQGLKTLPRRLEWDPIFRAHLKKLDEKKPVILCGDMNVSHLEIGMNFCLKLLRLEMYVYFEFVINEHTSQMQ